MQQRSEIQELELQKSIKKTQEAMALATEESAKTKAAKEVIKSLTAQVFSETNYNICFHFTRAPGLVLVQYINCKFLLFPFAYCPSL